MRYIGQRTCRTCKKTKGSEHFQLKVSKSGEPGWPLDCRKCVYAATSVRQADRRERLARIKAATGCERCGISDSRVLQFDHKDPYSKSFNVSQGLCKGWDVLLAEIEKCRVLCANCHIIHTLSSGHHKVRRPMQNKKKRKKEKTIRSPDNRACQEVSASRAIAAGYQPFRWLMKDLPAQKRETLRRTQSPLIWDA